MRRIMHWIAALLAAYLLLVVLMYFLQDWMIFPGQEMSDGGVERAPPSRVAVERLRRPDGKSFRVAIGVPERPRAVLLFFVGNGENLQSCVWRSERMLAYEMLTVCPEYPGYGESEGRPSMQSLLETADSTAAHALELARERGLPLVVGGSSLGSFCAVHVVAQGIGERLLLKAPPTSMAAAAGSRYPFLPVRLLLKHPFDNLAVADRVRCPVLVVHGDADRVVPIAMGRELVAAIGENAELLAMPGIDHNDPALDPEGPAAARIRAFLHGR